MLFRSAVPMLFSTETCPSEKRVVGSLRDMLQEAGSLIREKSFVLFLAIMALLTIPVWAYVSISSYVYINDFGLSNLMYGAFYAVGSVLSFLGPILYILLNKAMQTSHVVTFAIILAAIGGVELLTTGKISPVLFLLAVGPLMIAEGVIRPLGLVVLLEEHADKAGTASSLIHFVLNVVGSVGASLATLNWLSQIAGAGGITVCCVVAAVSCWMVIVRRKLLKRRLGF